MENQVKMASEAQINYLRKLGYQGSTANLTNEQASNLIKSYSNRAGQEQAQQSNYGGYNPQYGSPAQEQYGAPNPTATNSQPSATPQQFTLNEVSVVSNLGIVDDLISNLNKLAGDGVLYIPTDYSVGNALKSAMTKIMTSEQADLLLACTPESKCQALTEYVTQGLDASKNQAYFMPAEIKKKGADGKKYGTGQYQMVLMRSYFGDALVAKRTGLVEEPYAIVIYQGDEVEIGFDEKGRKTLISHKTKFENQDNPIAGAYACLIGHNGYKYYEFMTRKELEAAWSMSKNYGEKNKLQTVFTQEAAKRTVIRRAVKMLFNSSENTTKEQTELIASYNRTTADEYDNETGEYVEGEVTTEAVNKKQKEKTASKKIEAPTPEKNTSEEWPD